MHIATRLVLCHVPSAFSPHQHRNNNTKTYVSAGLGLFAENYAKMVALSGEAKRAALRYGIIDEGRMKDSLATIQT